MDKTSFKISDSAKTGAMAFMKSIFICQAQLMVTRFNAEDNQAICGTSDGRICIFNLNTSNKICDLEITDSTTPITNMKVNIPMSSKMTSLLCCNAMGRLIEMQIVGKNLKRTWEHLEENNYFQGLTYSPTYEHFAAAGQNCIIKVFDNQKKVISAQLKGSHWQQSGHNNRIFCLKYHPTDKSLLFSGGWDQNVRMWDIRSGQPTRGFVGPKICGEAIDINESGEVLTGSARSKEQIQLWDMGSQKLLKNIEYGLKGQDTDMIYSCMFEKNMKNSILAGGSSSVKMFMLDEEKEKYERTVEITEITSSVYTVDSGNNNPKFMFGNSQGQCIIFNISRTE